MIDADYPDNLALLTNTVAWCVSLLCSLEEAAGSIGHYVNVHKT